MHTLSLTTFLLESFLVFNCNNEVMSRFITVKVDGNKIVQFIDNKFVGVTLDTSLIADGWKKFDFKSQKLLNLARALSPCFVRVGGTAADRLIFNPLKKTINKPNNYPLDDNGSLQSRKFFFMSTKDWDLLNNFVAEVGWDLIFDLNVLLRKSGRWDPSNAIELLEYSVKRGYNVSGFELGNEPNSFHHVFNVSVTPQELAYDVLTLQNILKQKFPYFKSSIVVGPDTTQVEKKRAYKYLEEFLIAARNHQVNAASWHHYYVDARTATLSQFTDPDILDSVATQIVTSVNLTYNVTMATTPVWLGETSSAYGGGADGLSNSYVAGFMWLDKLGLSSKLGLQTVLRQSFYKGFYSLLDNETLDPNPDYWLTFLYKQLVGNSLNVFQSEQSNKFRVYAHCTRKHNIWKYPPGSLVLYILNLHSESVNISLPQFSHLSYDLFLLTPGEDQNLKSRSVKLNGKLLRLTDEEKLPFLQSEKVKDVVTFPALSFGFVVIQQAAIKTCRY